VGLHVLLQGVQRVPARADKTGAFLITQALSPGQPNIQ
jgi:hypothetical protein